MNNYCPNCGSEVNDEYCTNCGAKVDSISPEIGEMFDNYMSGKSSTSRNCAIIFTVIWVLVHLFFTFIGSSFFGFFDKFRDSYYGGGRDYLSVYFGSSLIACFYSFIPFVIAYIFSLVSKSKKLVVFHSIFLFFHVILFCISKFL